MKVRILAFLLAYPVLAGATVRAAAADPAPKLVMILALDQCRADYLERFGPWLRPDGFKRLLREGTSFPEARYRHSITQTAPGHAQMSTGAFSRRHGIVGNDWLDRNRWQTVNCVEDADSPLVGVSPAELSPEAALAPARTGRSPRNLMLETLADVLKARYGSESRVVGVAGKDRAAILLTGQRGDVVLWKEAGRFISSRHYGAALPAWVDAFNQANPAAAHFGSRWERLLPASIYDQVQGPDDAEGEETGLGLGRTFPRTITGGEATPGRRFLVALENTPIAAEKIGLLAQRAITEERLGRHRGVDLLAVSFSTLDDLGHRYGPDSHEIMDLFLHLDRIIADLLDHLDREVGLTRCVIALTGDHGVPPLPERQASSGAQRLKLATIDARLRTELDSMLGPAPASGWFQRDSLSYHVTPAAAEKAGDGDRVADAIARALRAMPEIAVAYTAQQLARQDDDADPLLGAARRSWNATRRRDVLFYPKPFVVPREGTGTTHGLPYDYDTRVPLVFCGPGIPTGKVDSEPVGVENLAPTLAARLGLKLVQAEGRDLFPPR